MRDGHGRHTHLDYDLADQFINDTGHDWIEAGGGFIEEDNFRFRSNGSGEADTFLHAARELCGKTICHLRCQTHAAQFFNGNFASLCGRPLERAALKPEGYILPDRH